MPEPQDVSIEPLRESDLRNADRIFRTSFSTFLGMPDPTAFMEHRDLVRGRFTAYPDGALGAFAAGKLVGSNFLARWGTFGWFGPLTVDPDYWGRGIAKRLLERTVETFDRWDIRACALFTFADSVQHHALYQRFDFWPRYLTALMKQPVHQARELPAVSRTVVRFSSADDERRKACLRDGRALTSELLPGLDVSREAEVVQALGLGDSVWLWEGTSLAAFAVCHFGVGSEAAPETCYVKFGAARPGDGAAARFEELLRACDALAAHERLATIEAGMNFERSDAYRLMLRAGYASEFCGVAMFRANDPAYSRKDAFVIDDLR